MFSRVTRRTVSILLITILMTAGIIPSALASIPAKINTSSAKVFSSASSSASSVDVPKNLKVSITSISGSWTKVSYKGRSAYMPMKHLTPTQKVKGYATDSTAVYNSSGKKKGTIARGTGVYVLGTIDGYYCVTNESGAIGYVKTGTLSESKPKAEASKSGEVTNVTSTVSTKSTSNLSKIDTALSVANKLLGVPYKLSDNPPHSFNCSSFVQYCMGKAGYSMKGTAAAQAADGRYARIDSTSDLKKGDVLCFDTSEDGKVDHSAIYLGGGRFIEASQKAGMVQTNSLSSWYKNHFVCARRP